jgi:putative phage-type endonuclease
MTAVAEMQLTGVALSPLDPGSPDWLKTMSASKVAAALGVSPYESPFSLWHRMANLIASDSDAPELARGHYLEAGVAAWFADQHPEWTIRPGGCWAHPDHPIYTASPDRLAILPDGAVRGVEVKTSSDDTEWGEAGTDQVPVGIRAQVMWQMLVVGTRVTHIAVLSAYLNLTEYVVAFDADEAEFIRAHCQKFLDSLPTGPNPQRPSIDSHNATYEAVRRLHPDIDGTDVELDPETARQFCHARHALAKATAAETYAKSLVLDELGQAKRARYLGQTIAQRQAKAEGVPYLVAGRNLPTFDQEEALPS